MFLAVAAVVLLFISACGSSANLTGTLEGFPRPSGDAAEAAYRAWVVETYQRTKAAVLEFADWVDRWWPGLPPEEWVVAELQPLADQLKQLHAEAVRHTPPPGFAQFHEAFAAALGTIAEGTDLYVVGALTHHDGLIRESFDRVGRGSQLLWESTRLLTWP